MLFSLQQADMVCRQPPTLALLDCAVLSLTSTVYSSLSRPFIPQPEPTFRSHHCGSGSHVSSHMADLHRQPVIVHTGPAVPAYLLS